MIIKKQDCKNFLIRYRRNLEARPEDTLNKRVTPNPFKGWRAPNGKFYSGHCCYCAEVAYLMDIYEKEGKNDS